MKIDIDGKNNKITIDVAPGEPWEKILDYLGKWGSARGQ